LDVVGCSLWRSPASKEADEQEDRAKKKKNNDEEEETRFNLEAGVLADTLVLELPRLLGDSAAATAPHGQDVAQEAARDVVLLPDLTTALCVACRQHRSGNVETKTGFWQKI
jgi:hypothetical protein